MNFQCIYLPSYYSKIQVYKSCSSSKRSNTFLWSSSCWFSSIHSSQSESFSIPSSHSHSLTYFEASEITSAFMVVYRNHFPPSDRCRWTGQGTVTLTDLVWLLPWFLTPPILLSTPFYPRPMSSHCTFQSAILRVADLCWIALVGPLWLPALTLFHG